MIESISEARLNALMKQYGNPDRTRLLTVRFTALVHRMEGEGHPPELVAFAVAQHAAALVAAMKMAGLMRPELADALAADFVDSIVNRAIVGGRAFAEPR